MMRVARYASTAPDGIEVVEVQKPTLSRGCRRGFVLVKVAAAGVNPVDVKYLIGDKLPETCMDWSARRVSGIVAGFDLSGTVVDAPEGSPFPIGTEVFGLSADPAKITSFQGSFADFVLSPVNQLCRKPEGLTHVEAAALPLGITTVLQAFEQHHLEARQRLLVLGAAGGVGHLAVQAAHGLGVSVVAVCSAAKRDFVSRLGASLVIAYDEGDVIAALAADAQANGAFDMVLDCVHSVAEQDRGRDYETMLHGHGGIVKGSSVPGTDGHNYVVLGGRTGQWGLALIKRICRCNCFRKGFEVFWINMPKCQPSLERAAVLCGTGLRASIQHVRPFSEESVRACFQDMRGRRVAGKVVLSMAD